MIDRSGGQVVYIDYEIPAAARQEHDALRLNAGSGLLESSLSGMDQRITQIQADNERLWAELGREGSDDGD